MRTPTTPALLAGCVLVTVVNTDTETELLSDLKLLKTKRIRGEQCLVGRGLGGVVTNHGHRVITRAALLVGDNTCVTILVDLATLVAVTNTIVVQVSHRLTLRIGQAHLDTVTVPGIAGGMLVLVIGDNDTEVKTLVIPCHCDGGGVIVRSAPCATCKLCEGGIGGSVDLYIALAGFASVTGLETRLNEGHAGPIRQVAIDFDGLPIRVVLFVTGFNPVLCV